MTHSPTPWSYDLGEIFDCCHNPIIFNFKDGEVSHADAAFICRAVNAHDDLVAALAGFEIKGPDADGLLWLVINGVTKKAMFNLGRANGIAAEAAVLFEQTRKAALAKAGA